MADAPLHWKSSPFDIVKHPLMCLSTLCAPPTTYYLISEAVEDVPAQAWEALLGGYCCCVGFQIRTRLRRKYNLQGNRVEDFLAHCLCHCFALQHDLIEAKSWKHTNGPASPTPGHIELDPSPGNSASRPVESHHGAILHSAQVSSGGPTSHEQQDQPSSQDRRQLVDSAIINKEAIDVMRDELVDNFDPGAGPFADPPHIPPLTLPSSSQHSLPSPSYLPQAGTDDTIPSTRSDRKSPGGRANQRLAGSQDGPPVDMGSRRGSGANRNPIFLPSGAETEYPQVPQSIPPVYPGSGSYSAHDSSGRYSSLGSGRDQGTHW